MLSTAAARRNMRQTVIAAVLYIMENVLPLEKSSTMSEWIEDGRVGALFEDHHGHTRTNTIDPLEDLNDMSDVAAPDPRHSGEDILEAGHWILSLRATSATSIDMMNKETGGTLRGGDWRTALWADT
ncbi:MAG: hypothetical protein CBC48_11980 [bacterium TMED88]|nr:MAG: hypothetical protein CBC48_11980 [bacterium TMED88]